MSIETKKISDLEQLETVSEIANVLIEDGGSAKRFPAKKLGAVKTVNGTAPDENGNVQIDAGGVSSWNDLEDKPFGTDTTVVNFVYDENHECNSVVESGKTMYYVAGKMTGDHDKYYVNVVFPGGNVEMIGLDEYEDVAGGNALGYFDLMPKYEVTVHDFYVTSGEQFDFTLFYWRGMGHSEADGFYGSGYDIPQPGWYVIGKYDHGGNIQCYIESVVGERITKIEEELLPDYLNNAKVYWENIIDVPFGSDKSYTEFEYDDENENGYNITLQSGEVIYYVNWDRLYGNLPTFVTSEYAGELHEDLFENVLESRQELVGTNENGDETSVYLYKFNITDETYSSNPFTMFDVSTYNIQVEYEGETILFPESGIYILGNKPYIKVINIGDEHVYQLESKYVDIAQEVHDRFVERNYTLCVEANITENTYMVHHDPDKTFGTFYDLLNDPTYYLSTYPLTAWCRISEATSRVKLVSVQQFSTGLETDENSNDFRVIDMAPCGYSFDTKYFRWHEDGTVTLVEVETTQ